MKTQLRLPFKTSSKTLLVLIILFSSPFKSITSEIKVKPALLEADKSALTEIITEKYYVSDASDEKDKTGGFLPRGSVTYRIYAHMKEGYKLQAVFGIPGHVLRLQSSTGFFNNTAGGEATGDKIDDRRINENTIALDSWVAMGAATRSHYAVLKSEDNDGSIIKRTSLSKADGLLASKNIPSIITFGLDLGFFSTSTTSTLLTTDNASWAVIGGVKGPTPENKVLIAQLTTNGKLSFELNLQMGTPTGGTVRFVAKNPAASEVQFEGLIHAE